jgi:hypothetical protein
LRRKDYSCYLSQASSTEEKGLLKSGLQTRSTSCRAISTSNLSGNLESAAAPVLWGFAG